MTTPPVAARTRLRRIAPILVIAVLAWLTPIAAAAQTMDHDAAPATHPEVVVHAFGSVDWASAGEPGEANSFGLGQLALFMTSAINDRVSVLAEIVLEASAANTQVTTDLERLQLTYRLNDHLNLSAGRYHTGIGFYNAAFHHGSYFETTIGRPRVFAFEDEGGVLPVHEVGLSARGIVPKTGSALRYVAEVGNGRRWTELDEHEGLDQNDAKSTNVGLALRPERWRGAEVGASWYRDDVPGAATTVIKNDIVAAYAVYRTPAVELMGEWLRLSYQPNAAGQRVDNHGGYVQASRAFGTIRPYYRFDIGDFTAANFDAVAYVRDHHREIATLRLKDRRKTTGENLPWGEGDAPIREVLRLVKQEAWPIRGYVEYDYAGPTGAIDEVKKCLAYASEAMM